MSEKNNNDTQLRFDSFLVLESRILLLRILLLVMDRYLRFPYGFRTCTSTILLCCANDHVRCEPPWISTGVTRSQTGTVVAASSSSSICWGCCCSTRANLWSLPLLSVAGRAMTGGASVVDDDESCETDDVVCEEAKWSFCSWALAAAVRGWAWSDGKAWSRNVSAVPPSRSCACCPSVLVLVLNREGVKATAT